MAFSATGNIEIRRKGNRELIGQYADGRFILHSRYENDGAAQQEIEQCAEIVKEHGRPEPIREYRNY